jgi:hypothetical protein
MSGLSPFASEIVFGALGGILLGVLLTLARALVGRWLSRLIGLVAALAVLGWLYVGWQVDATHASYEEVITHAVRALTPRDEAKHDEHPAGSVRPLVSVAPGARGGNAAADGQRLTRRRARPR